MIYEFLSYIFRHKDDNECVEIRCLGDDKPRRLMFKDIRQITPRLIKAIQQDNYNIYFGVAARQPDFTVSSVGALWVDIDFKDLADGKLIPKKSLVVMQLVTSNIPPSILVSSGHGIHAYWLLTQQLTDFELAKDLMKRLAKTFCGDSCYDTARILRLPGSLNVKDINNPVLCEVVGGNYTFYDISDIMGNTIDLPSIDGTKIATIIETGDTSSYKSRSEADFGVISELIHQGYSYDEIYEIYETKPIGEKFREKGNNQEAYFKTTYDAARRKVR